MTLQTIIVWDFTGIQEYIYNIRKNKAATRRLRGRSIFIDTLLEYIKNWVIDELGKCEEYVVSGWKFVIIANHFDERSFLSFQRKLEEKLYTQFYGQLKIIFWITEYKEWEFKSSLDNAYKNLEENKFLPMKNLLQESWKWEESRFIFENDRGNESVCSFTKWDLKSVFLDDPLYAPFVNSLLVEENLDWLSLNVANDLAISDFVTKKWSEWKIRIFENEYINLNKKFQNIAVFQLMKIHYLSKLLKNCLVDEALINLLVLRVT